MIVAIVTLMLIFVPTSLIIWGTERHECDCTYVQFLGRGWAGVVDMARHLW